MKDYVFSIFKRPKLCELYFDLLDQCSTIILDIYAFDHGKYKACTIKSSLFEDGDLTEFVKANTRLRVSAIHIAFGAVTVDCY